MRRDPVFWWSEDRLAASLLRPAAWIYGRIAASRMSAAGESVDVPVICVGNLTLGGAGKTPTALALANILTGLNEKPFFLSRGYGGNMPGPVRVDPAKHRAADVGDEPLLLARKAPTVVAADRLAGAKFAADAGATVIVMDDGLQNPSLKKDLAIAVIDGRRGLGNRHVFPAGPLRAPLQAQLQHVDALLVIGDPSPRTNDVIAAAKSKKHPVLRATLRADQKIAADIARRKVLAFAGIGDPEKFFMTLAMCGIEASAEETFADHHPYSEADAERLLARCEREGLVPVTTEKDFVRLNGDGAMARLRAKTKTLPVALSFASQDEALQLIKRKLAKR